MVYHEPSGGRLQEYNHLERLVLDILSGEKKQYGCPGELSIVTWSNFKEPTVLEKTCCHLGIPLNVYGKNIEHWTSNYKNKIDLMLSACSREKTKYIMGLDSVDVVILAPPSEILEEFRKINSKMIFSSEINLAFLSGKSEIHQFFNSEWTSNKTPFKYLNAGGWIAEREFAKRFFQKTRTLPPHPEKPSSDQVVVSQSLCHNEEFHEKIDLDRTCKIFQVYTSKTSKYFLTDSAGESEFMRRVKKIQGIFHQFYTYTFKRFFKLKVEYLKEENLNHK